MAATRNRRYSAEYRQRMIALVRSGRSPESLSREFEVSAQSIRKWLVRADQEEGREPNGPSPEELRVENRALKRKLRRVEEEREILKKAAAWFARETTSGSFDS